MLQSFTTKNRLLANLFLAKVFLANVFLANVFLANVFPANVFFFSGTQTPHTGPTLLPLLLKTLSLLLHASGSSTLSLPALTTDFWALLLSLRPRASDISVLEAILFGFLTLLDVNAPNQRRVAEEHASELLETREWVQGVFERMGSGLGDEGERIRMLSAGVLMRTGEVVESWQRLMAGELSGFL